MYAGGKGRIYAFCTVCVDFGTCWRTIRGIRRIAFYEEYLETNPVGDWIMHSSSNAAICSEGNGSSAGRGSYNDHDNQLGWHRVDCKVRRMQIDRL